jgi:hypothetical protein
MVYDELFYIMTEFHWPMEMVEISIPISDYISIGPLKLLANQPKPITHLFDLKFTQDDY